MTDSTRTLLAVARREASAAMLACLRAGEPMASAIHAGGAVYVAELAHASPETPVVVDARIAFLDSLIPTSANVCPHTGFPERTLTAQMFDAAGPGWTTSLPSKLDSALTAAEQEFLLGPMHPYTIGAGECEDYSDVCQHCHGGIASTGGPLCLDCTQRQEDIARAGREMADWFI